jgi:hypothetical protein
VRLPLVLLAGRADADVAGENGVGRRQRRAERERRPQRQPHHRVAEQRDRRDRQRHGDQQEARDRAPGLTLERPLDLQPRREERDDHRQLGEVLQQRRVLLGVDPGDVGEVQADRADQPEPEVDDARRERPLVLVRQRPDGREDRDAGEDEDDRVGVAGGEALLGGRDESSCGVGTTGCCPVRAGAEP